MKKIAYILLCFVSLFTHAQTKPNILFIITDDWGYHDLSYNGSKLYNTPNVDNLAKNAITFTNAYSSYPRCTPSRYAMLTGTYPVNEDKGNLAEMPEEKNFASIFNNEGYHTFYIGKWHLGEGGAHPKNFGFKTTYAAGRSGGLGSRFYPFNTQKNGKPAKEPVEDLEEDGKPGDYASDLMTDKVIKLIENTPKGEPFMGVLAYYAVHTPLEAKQQDIDRNKNQLKSIDFGNTPEYIKEGAGRRKMRQDNPVYAAMVENIDENLGRIIEMLKNKNLLDNTIIVLTSDHGGLSNDGFKGERELATTNNPLRAGKGWLYEGGIRVPLIWHYGKNFKPHREENSIVMGMDIFPTLLDLAINKQVKEIDGKSYKSILLGKDSWENRSVFWNSNKARPHSTGDPKETAVRSGDYKLLYFKDTNTYELYNLKQDVSESHNISSENPSKLDEMKSLLKAWKKEYLVPSRMDIGKNKGKEKSDKQKK
ncbi:sulfatase [Aestuariibaculum suncheonense]|uniref:Sulfatase n=1 Tax=Aestuariibaculum suncheonense TaxID=1028745 RepID=A0A8J6Q6M5_9FLAO|nr:sulfatase [Aestuariibaculum suncheonense]MBD0835643.1 sulfatase [Aestuariibaculum suncheonense]